MLTRGRFALLAKALTLCRVALSRHRDNATVFCARDDFGGRPLSATPASVHDRFTETLSRARPEELAHDYLDREGGYPAGRVPTLVVTDWEKRRQADSPSN